MFIVRRLLSFVLVLIVTSIVLSLMALHKSAPPPAPVSPQEAADAKTRLTQSLALPPTPQPPTAAAAIHGTAPAETATLPPAQTQASGDVATVHVNETDLNETLAGNAVVQAKLAQHGVSGAQITFKAPDEADTVAQFTYGGKTADVTVKGVVAADGHGGLGFTPNAVYIGMLPVPAGAMTSRIYRAGRQLLATATQRLPITVQSVSVHDNALWITGPRK